MNTEQTCATCGTQLIGKFCYSCGEKKVVDKDFALVKFLEQSIDIFTHFDSKFFLSFAKVFQPGFLANEFVKGRRVLYLKPLQFFILINVFYFLVFQNANFFSRTLHEYTSYKPFTTYETKQLVSSKIETLKLDYFSFEKLFNTKSFNYSKTFLFVFIPLLGLLFYLFFFKSKKYLTQHLVFACYFFCYVLLLYMIIILLSIIGFRFVATDPYFLYFFQFGILSWLFIAINKFYNGNKVLNFVKSVIITYSIMFLIQYYRMVIFFFTLKNM